MGADSRRPHRVWPSAHCGQGGRQAGWSAAAGGGQAGRLERGCRAPPTMECRRPDRVCAAALCGRRAQAGSDAGAPTPAHVAPRTWEKAPQPASAAITDQSSPSSAARVLRWRVRGLCEGLHHRRSRRSRHRSGCPTGRARQRNAVRVAGSIVACARRGNKHGCARLKLYLDGAAPSRVATPGRHDAASQRRWRSWRPTCRPVGPPAGSERRVRFPLPLAQRSGRWPRCGAPHTTPSDPR